MSTLNEQTAVEVMKNRTSSSVAETGQANVIGLLIVGEIVIKKTLTATVIL